jgi:hypothetical protein
MLQENMTDFIAKKREIFLLQMSLDTKRAEIKKLDERARQREEAVAHVILLRHGEPDWYPGDGGVAVDDAGLTERGRAQAGAAAQAGCRLTGMRRAAASCSPAPEPARGLSSRPGAQPQATSGRRRRTAPSHRGTGRWQYRLTARLPVSQYYGMLTQCQ